MGCRCEGLVKEFPFCIWESLRVFWASFHEDATNLPAADSWNSDTLMAVLLSNEDYTSRRTCGRLSSFTCGPLYTLTSQERSVTVGKNLVRESPLVVCLFPLWHDQKERLPVSRFFLQVSTFKRHSSYARLSCGGVGYGVLVEWFKRKHNHSKAHTSIHTQHPQTGHSSWRNVLCCPLTLGNLSPSELWDDRL